jgi:hypothetical protein
MLAKLLFKAYENEATLDKRFKTLFEGSIVQSLSNIPNFKTMKLIALKEQYGIFFSLSIFIARICMPFYILIQCFYSFFTVLWTKNFKERQTNVIVPITKERIPFIKEVINLKADVLSLSIYNLSKHLTFIDYFRCLNETIQLSLLFFGKSKVAKSDLILHCHDCFKFLLFCRYVQINPQCNYITDDHYQRWAFLLSHLSNNVSIVQHGFLDDGIEFPHNFGKIKIIYLRNENFHKLFSRYFSSFNFKVFKRILNTTVINNVKNGVFLASSFPRINEEIELLQEIRKYSPLPIIIKLHPRHSYSNEKKILLLSYASYVCKNDEFPLCSIFISYNSYLEYEYKDLGIFTYSIERDNLSMLHNKILAIE